MSGLVAVFKALAGVSAQRPVATVCGFVCIIRIIGLNLFTPTVGLM